MSILIADSGSTKCEWCLINNGKSETIIFIFAGASAEFALNKAVDWLFFTGKLPADPLGRLFSTVAYAQKIVFAETTGAIQSIRSINAIHSAVEHAISALGIVDDLVLGPLLL